MEVKLIRPPFDEWYENQGQLTGLVAPPIGLCLIAKAIRENNDCSVEVIDGLNRPMHEITKDLGRDVVGVTEDYSKHSNALEILKKAKQRGAKTFIGGPNVTYLSDNILRNHEFVDYAVVGDGEETLPFFLNGLDLSEIPNLVYRDNGRIIKNQRRNAQLNTFYDLEDIVDLDLKKENALPLSMIRGCIKAEEKGRCSFCSINHGLKVMSPKKGWEQIALLNKKYGVSYFWETGDSFIVGNFPEYFLKQRPNDLSHVEFRVYVRPDQLDEKNTRILSELNVRSLYIGVESGDNNVLNRANKAYESSDIERALDLAHQHSLPIHVPFMLGLPGTTEKTLEDDLRLAERMIKKFPGMMMITSLPVLFPGTELFNNIRDHPNIREDYSGDLFRDDTFDYRRLFELNLKYFTQVDYTKVRGVYNKLRDLVSGEGNFTSFALNRK